MASESGGSGVAVGSTEVLGWAEAELVDVADGPTDTEGDALGLGLGLATMRPSAAPAGPEPLPAARQARGWPLSSVRRCLMAKVAAWARDASASFARMLLT